MTEPEMMLPPWPQKRRIMAASLLTGFILLAAVFIGIGIYQIAVDSGKIRPPLTKKTVTSALSKDISFIKAVNHASKLKECDNKVKHFWLTYQSPLHPLTTAPKNEVCQHFVAMHPTGADVFVDLESVMVSREQLMLEKAKEYDSVQADLLSGTNYQIGRLSGMRQGVQTVTYVIGTDISASWILTYKLTSPTLDNIVQEMAISFRLY